MKRSIALLGLFAMLWALGSTWYYDCKIKRVCGPEQDELAVPQVLLPSATTRSTDADVGTSPPANESGAGTTLETQPIQMKAAPALAGPADVLTVSFDARSAAVVPPPDVEARLEMLRRGVAAGQKILVRGHSDGRGARERIAVVSRERAESLRDWLLTQGFAASAIAGVESREDRDPIANNGQAEGRAKNRRAEALLVPSS